MVSAKDHVCHHIPGTAIRVHPGQGPSGHSGQQTQCHTTSSGAQDSCSSATRAQEDHRGRDSGKDADGNQGVWWAVTGHRLPDYARTSDSHSVALNISGQPQGSGTHSPVGTQATGRPRHTFGHCHAPTVPGTFLVRWAGCSQEERSGCAGWFLPNAKVMRGSRGVRRTGAAG